MEIQLVAVVGDTFDRALREAWSVATVLKTGTQYKFNQFECHVYPNGRFLVFNQEAKPLEHMVGDLGIKVPERYEANGVAE